MRCLTLASWFIPVLLTLLVKAANKPRLVNLRVEGAADTIFEALILTRGHNITTESGGTHHCDGTNLGANAEAGSTCTSALADAARLKRFSFDGTFFTEFDDYFITRIADSAQTDAQFWGILLNFVFTPVGGCQQQVRSFDQILWAFDAFNAQHFLKLDGPHAVHVGKPATFTVVDGLNDSNTPISNAAVGGGTTGADGRVTLSFTTPGLHSLKATRSDSIRSNRFDVLVV